MPDIQQLPSVFQQTKSFVHKSIRSENEIEKEETEKDDINEVKNDYRKKIDKEESTERTSIEDAETSHPLFSHGMCRWTGCELAGFKDLESFKDHLKSDHVLDERSTAQTRVQVSTIIV